ncbi:M23 family metallopeptidase [Hymenobacter properus]|uniref:M23 family metallopeptidase n=1 Tax=Hymenobacter properus TaxID=2791026 RepID=A0A931FK42_9BACT|nr:M23 family metallopeptidase [Hymenobacter properus]MBF9140626.1 M23 family metallopeptidase [Hymenobacter properus]MBR7719434.1 M23 family metallopeptidase [Microvirga sp. SRT04]
MLFKRNVNAARPTTQPRARVWWGLFAVALLGLGGCSKQQTLQALFQKSTPHEAYARQLHQAGLDQRPAGRAWLGAASQALRDSLVVTLPFAETGYFRPERPTAASYRYAVRAGEQVHVSLALAPGVNARAFVDAFEVGPGRRLLPLASADTLVLDFRYRAENDGQHLLRLQPELLAAGRYTLRLSREPSLSVFPVQGRTDAAVGSFWGAARDAGARQHEGIDIFAPRGTPAVAAVAGYITRTGETPLGGRVVWLAADGRPDHLYYAHLDKQLVTPGQRVQPGDTLGLVGNTGNARTTVPHLHFGIYRGGRGALDPFPFVQRPAAPAPTPAGPDRRGEFVRLRKGAALQATPSSKTNRQAELAAMPARVPLLVLGQQGAALRVQLPSGEVGYVPAQGVVAAAAAPLRRLSLSGLTELHAGPAATAPAIGALAAGTAVAVLGQAQAYSLVRGPRGETGWAVL